MARSLSAGMLSDVAAGSAEMVQFIELSFSGGTTRLATAAVDVLWNGFTWTAIGGGLDIDGFTESPEFDSNGMPLRLSGVDQTILSLILGQSFVGRSAKVWHGHLDKTTGVVVSTPVLMFDGRMNEGWDIAESWGSHGGGQVTISTTLSARLNELNKYRGIRTNLVSHQSSGISGVTTDTFFQNVAALVGAKIYWGTKAPNNEPHPGGKLPVTMPPGLNPSTGASPHNSTPLRPGSFGGTFGGPSAPKPSIDTAPSFGG